MCRYYDNFFLVNHNMESTNIADYTLFLKYLKIGRLCGTKIYNNYFTYNFELIDYEKKT